ncbi:SusC/RagA family TonB-linked outer membrane protein [Apibacter sp. HY039]|uniref:SusC/RagA family TonB-linked outer membrane protein n=1 Tax=Apibacter sp. HY039 TaxID=2501476 RepID=UPI000FEBE267|nr:SusC/RagA family TonB-linked outer membrane protein [Apibacter sp. HY039]
MRINRIFLGFSFVFLSSIVWAQMKTITGKVLGVDGTPQSDVSVTIQGTTQSVYTDETGQFSIEAEPGQTIEIASFNDEKSSFVVGNQNFYDVKLHATAVTSANPTTSKGETELEGVVVTALNITRDKKSLGYAIQAVSGDDISKTRESNPINSLSGKVAGLQIVNNSGTLGGSTQIRLRGMRSLSQSNKPLIVIDGIPLIDENINSSATQRGAGGIDYGDSFGDINPDDIESMSVLKGATAAALYGSRAMNGAIMITTKKAKRGKTDITLNSGIIIDKVYKMPRHQKLYGGGSSSQFKTQNINGTDYLLVDYKTDESWGPKYDPNKYVLNWNAFDPEFSEDYLVAKPWTYPKNDYKDYFKTGITYNNGISISRSIENTNVRVGYNNTKSTGITPNSELNKNALSMNLNTKLNDRLKLDASAAYTVTKGFNRPEVGYGDNSIMQKMFQFGQTSLDYKDLQKYQLANGVQRPWNRTSWNDATPAYSDNPYWTAYKNTNQDKRDRLYGTAGLTYDLTSDIYVNGKVMLDTYSTNTENRTAMYSQSTSKYITSERKYTELNYEATIHFDKNLGNFSINSFAGANRRDFRARYVEGQTRGGLIVADLYNLSNSVETPAILNSKRKKRVNSLFYSLSLGYDNFVFLETTGRNDWSSSLSSANNSFFYPSVSSSFVLTRYIKTTWLDFLKVRAGYSEVRNDTDAYQLSDTYLNSESAFPNYGTNFLGNPWYWVSRVAKNPNLKPEKLESLEFGLEFQLLKNRISGDISYYKTITKDLITTVPLDGSAGVPWASMNSGKLLNQGVEVSLNINPIRTKDFRWDFNYNFSKSDNEIKSLAQGLTSLTIASAPFNVAVAALPGYRYGQIYGTDYVYLNGKRVVNSNGVYKKTSSPVALGSILPDFTMTFRNSFSYKNWSLGVQVDWQKGGKYFSTTHLFGMYSGILPETAANGIRENGIVLDGVKEDGSVNDINISARSYGQQFYSGPDAQNVFDADFVKLREVSLSYTLPGKYLGEAINSITFSAFGRNLFAWGLAWNSIDPEVANYGSGNASGIEGGSLPTTRSFGFNVQVKF